jgi:predicted RNase H-like HicB family nuclease
VTEYALYLESGPQHKKTMVHIPQLLGCIANGPTTEAALEAVPEAIRAYRRFLGRCGEAADPDTSFTTAIAEHVTKGDWLGNGSPYITYAPDLEPVSEEEVATFRNRLARLREELAAWAEAQDNATLDSKVPGSSRSARAILLHVMGPTAAYAAPIIGTVRGVSALQTEAERGQTPIPEALRRTTASVIERLKVVSDDERSMVLQRPKEVRTLRKALRRMLEHDWEHLAELSRRPGGPQL